MSDPWLTIVGLTEDGLAGLSKASLAALERAEIIFGGARHLALIDAGQRGMAWPIPFSIEPIMAQRGRNVVALVSGDPFWFGAGSTLAGHLDPQEFQTLSAPSIFSLIAAHLGWPIQTTVCTALHAAPFEILLPHLHRGTRIIATLRDARSASELADWLTQRGFGESLLHIVERMGGAEQKITSARADAVPRCDTDKLVACAIEVAGAQGLPRGFGLSDERFASDGQITKRVIRAMTLSTLAPRNDDLLWDLGAGSGSISVEWCLNGGRSIAVEQKASRVTNITENARRFGVEARLSVRLGDSIALCADLPDPDAVFIGGGASAALIGAVVPRLKSGSRLVVNAVTLETEAVLIAEQAARGGRLMKIDVSETEPLGRMRGWTAARPVVQWSYIR